MTRLEQILKMAEIIQDAEKRASVGLIDTKSFPSDEITRFGLQRLAAASELIDAGYILPEQIEIGVLVKDGMVTEVTSNEPGVDVEVVDLDVQDPEELNELESRADWLLSNRHRIW